MPGNTAKPTSSAPTDFRCTQPRYTLNKDVILSASVRSQLDEALLKIEHYQKIYVEWASVRLIRPEKPNFELLWTSWHR